MRERIGCSFGNAKMLTMTWERGVIVRETKRGLQRELQP